MQAVLLCEYYARFRGRSKEAYRPSSRFNALCQMVSLCFRHGPENPVSRSPWRLRPSGQSTSDPVSSSDTLTRLQVAGQHMWEATLAGSTDSQRWREWVRVESCRRLAACFLLSVHGNWYYEQPFTADLGLDNFSPMMLSIPLSASSTRAWEAESVEIWAGLDVATVRIQTGGRVAADLDPVQHRVHVFR